MASACQARPTYTLAFLHNRIYVTHLADFVALRECSVVVAVLLLEQLLYSARKVCNLEQTPLQCPLLNWVAPQMPLW
jgi:hypothetical protein